MNFNKFSNSFSTHLNMEYISIWYHKHRSDERKWHNFLVKTKTRVTKINASPNQISFTNGLMNIDYITWSTCNTPSQHLIFILCRYNHDYLLSLFPSCTHNLTTLPTVTKLYQTIICIQFEETFKYMTHFLSSIEITLKRITQ